MKRKLSIIALTLFICVQTIYPSFVVHAAGDKGIVLNGLISENQQGYLTEKTGIVKDNESLSVEYRLKPEFSTGEAAGVRVSLYLPSLKQNGSGDWVEVSQNEAPGPLGVKGTISSSDDWHIVNSIVEGGWVHLEFLGNLRPGSNPAFTLQISSYGGTLPEGYDFNIQGFVEYDNFNGEPGTSWQTEDLLDYESIVSVIATNLEWETSLKQYKEDEPLILWDRYQYANYKFDIANTSENDVSNINGFNVSLDIDSEFIHINGIPTFDINRWKYVEGGDPELNEDPEIITDTYVGVYDKGGIMIYDVTDIDDFTMEELIEDEESIPYKYSGAGLIEFNQSEGDNKKIIEPEQNTDKPARSYIIMIPLSRQKFPNLPTNFGVTSIGNIIFGKGTNWSKTNRAMKEILEPTPDFEFDHFVVGNKAIYDKPLTFKLENFKNTSDIPVFDVGMNYVIDENFDSKTLTYRLPDDIGPEVLDKLKITYQLTHDVKDINGNIIDHVIEDFELSGSYRNFGDGTHGYTYDLSFLENVGNLYPQPKEWDRELYFELISYMEIGEKLPVSFEFYGISQIIGNIENKATVDFVEKWADNEDLSIDTTYDSQVHYRSKNALVDSKPPKVIDPINYISFTGTNNPNKDASITHEAIYRTEVETKFHFGIEDDLFGDTSTFTAKLNTQSANGLHEAKLFIDRQYFEDAKNPVLYVKYFDQQDPVEYDLKTHQGDYDLDMGNKVEYVQLVSDDFESVDESNYVTIKAKIDRGNILEHTVNSTFSVYQGIPYNKVQKKDAKGIIKIDAPILNNEIYVSYLPTRTTGSTMLPYEANFDMDFDISIDKLAPKSRYVIEVPQVSTTNRFNINTITLTQDFINAVQDYEVVVEDVFGVKKNLANQSNIDVSTLGIGDIKKMTIEINTMLLADIKTAVVFNMDVDTGINTSSVFKSRFEVYTDNPYVVVVAKNAQHTILVGDARTIPETHGVTQVDNQGSNPEYDRVVKKLNNHGCAVNDYIMDYTHDQAYKSIGGFSTSLKRPTDPMMNNNQLLEVSVELPGEHFDLYYLKIKDQAEGYIKEVRIYRTEAGVETLWQTVDGSDWVANGNGSSGWRINTAQKTNSGADLFSTASSVNDPNHPYYKEPWASDVFTESPVTKVEFSFEFTQDYIGAPVQMPGENKHVIEFMGRFYDVKEDIGITNTEVEDTFGIKRPLKFDANSKIESLVLYPYAQGLTGVEDLISRKEKEIIMGSTGEYLANIFNEEQVKVPSYCIGKPAVMNDEHKKIVPERGGLYTLYDDWVFDRDSGFFHDLLRYEFVYPRSPDMNPTSNFNPEYIKFPESIDLKYIDEIRLYGRGDNTPLIISKADIEEDGFEINYDYTIAKGITKIGSVFEASFGIGVYPERLEVDYKQITGYGDSSAEIDGVEQNILGIDIKDIDIRFGGVVDGIIDLPGTSNLYRQYNKDEKLEKFSTTTAILRGVTPKINTRLTMNFDSLDVIDYKEDGVTPNESIVSLDIENVGQGDVDDVEMTFKPHEDFRARTIKIPEELFDGTDWKVSAASVDGEDILSYFTHNAAENSYELSLNPLFISGKLTPGVRIPVLGNPDVLDVYDSREIYVKFSPVHNRARLYGEISLMKDPTLPTKMRTDEMMYVHGDWVDLKNNTMDWSSMPTFVDETTRPIKNVVTKYTSFTVSAEVTPTYTGSISQGGGNGGMKPTLTRTHNYMGSIKLYNRLAVDTFKGVYLNEDEELATTRNLFYDPVNQDYHDFRNVAVGDTLKTLYSVTDKGIRTPVGNQIVDNPIVEPYFVVRVDDGMVVDSIRVIEDVTTESTNLQQVISDEGNLVNPIAANEYEITKESDTEYTVEISKDFAEKEAVYILVTYLTSNEFDSEDFNTQALETLWKSSLRNEFVHHFMSYNFKLEPDSYMSSSAPLEEIEDMEYVYGELKNHKYRFSDPNKLRVEGDFLVENVTGKEMTQYVRNIINEIEHDDTRLELHIDLDTNDDLFGFYLTQMPTPTYPALYTGDYAKPYLEYRYEGNWYDADDFVTNGHDFKKVDELKVDYGVVPRMQDGKVWEAPEIELVGVGQWQQLTKDNVKSYVINTSATSLFTHSNNVGVEDQYTFTHKNTRTVWKAISKIELNNQTYTTKGLATGAYDGAELEKTSYNPEEDIWYKMTAKNHNEFQGKNTTNPYGKADLVEPVMYDKIPEYLIPSFLGYIDGAGNLDVSSAVGDARGIMSIKKFDETDTEIPMTLPTITIDNVTGIDVGGDQTFSYDTFDTWFGYLSSKEPNDTVKNPAEEIAYLTLKIEFPEDIKRGERIEIVYLANSRLDDLPIAKAPDARPVYAPLMGWYRHNYPLVAEYESLTMDMASLFHDIGITGKRSSVETEEEFMASSYSWIVGGGDIRTPINNRPSYLGYYDDSANKQKSMKSYLNEMEGNRLYPSFTPNMKDNANANSVKKRENFEYILDPRVNDGKIVADERILWAENGIQLRRAWLYGASEMLPDKKKVIQGEQDSNFYEYDGNLDNRVKYNGSWIDNYNVDDHIYAVQLNEEFTVRLLAKNMGDRAIGSGVVFTEVLPIGISPYDAAGNLLGIDVYDGNNTQITNYTVNVIQTPTNDMGYKAPKQSQEERTYAQDYDSRIPYVVQISIQDPLVSLFKELSNGSDKESTQYVDLRVRVEEEIEPNGDLSIWYDELTVTSNAPEQYMTIYDGRYGKSTATTGYFYTLDSIFQGFNHFTTLSWSGLTRYAFEPYPTYIRGINAYGTTTEVDNKPAIVTGDQIAMRKPTLRIWSVVENLDGNPNYDSTMNNFNLQAGERVDVISTIENQQIEVNDEFKREADVNLKAHQTIGGARGSYFDPDISIVLPREMAYTPPTTLESGVVVKLYDITTHSKTEVADITNLFNVSTYETTINGLEHPVVRLTFKDTLGYNFELEYNQSIEIVLKAEVVKEPLGTTNNFTNLEVFAGTTRPVSNPIVSNAYVTGAAPVVNRNRSLTLDTIENADKKRFDSTSNYVTNMLGMIKITEGPIKPSDVYQNSTYPHIKDESTQFHDKKGAFGATVFSYKYPTLHNDTIISKEFGEPRDNAIDSQGYLWISSEAKNTPIENIDKNLEILTSGNILNSKFVFTFYYSNFVRLSNELMIEDAAGIHTKAEAEALGYEIVELHHEYDVDLLHRNRIQYLVIPPANAKGVRGSLYSGSTFTLGMKGKVVDGFDYDESDTNPFWEDDSLRVDSYISLITDDQSLIDPGATMYFVYQDPKTVTYVEEYDETLEQEDVDGDTQFDSILAKDNEALRLKKPQIGLRKNYTKPRELFSNGKTGDSYYTAVETMEYIINYAKLTDGSVNELIIEDALPVESSRDTSIETSGYPLDRSLKSITTGVWELPQTTLDKLSDAGKAIDDVYSIYMYTSETESLEVYDETDTDWVLRNPGGSSILSSHEVVIPVSESYNIKRIRWILRTNDEDNFPIEKGTRLDVDANPNTPQKEEVIETDPNNLSIDIYPSEVVDNSIRVNMMVASGVQRTVFVYNHVKMWGNYVNDKYGKLAQESARSYLTPTRPVVNVLYDSKYFKHDTTRPLSERFGWSSNRSINPSVSPYLKFTAEYINADESMWDRDEDIIYKEDMLIDPVVTFELPRPFKLDNSSLTYVSSDGLTNAHPLHDDYRSQNVLLQSQSNQFTYKVIRQNGTVDHNVLELVSQFTGPWHDAPKHIFVLKFKGMMNPGDRLVVDYIGSVDEYIPNADQEVFFSTAGITNNTGLLQPLNSRQNSANQLGYIIDKYDYDDNGFKNDRYINTGRYMFDFASFNDFGKRKISFSDLNPAGSTYPNASQVEEGGKYQFEISLDNPNSGNKEYPYPIMYDVLPFDGDTDMTSTKPRGSNFKGWIDPSSIEYRVEGASPRVFNDNEYTVYVGPLKKDGADYVEVDLPDTETVSKQGFYEFVLEDSYRSQYFVPLDDIKNDEELCKKIQSVLVLFTDRDMKLKGEEKFVLSYEMKAPLNNHVYDENEPGLNYEEYVGWNTFVGTQLVPGFLPQESNKAGVYVTTKKKRVSLGDYVWWDMNYNAEQDEVKLVKDENGRWIVDELIEVDSQGNLIDPGVNGVKVYLKSVNGYHVNKEGQSIAYDSIQDKWFLVDDDTGNLILDDTFFEPIESDAPVEYETQKDKYGHSGYYVLANIVPGDYRIEYEFPTSLNHVGLTTPESFNGTKLNMFDQGDTLPYLGKVANSFTVVSDVFTVTIDDSVDELMGFDVGIGDTIDVEGTVFEENIPTLDGIRQPAEMGLEDYNLRLFDEDDNLVTNLKGKSMEVKTDANGDFSFKGLPLNATYKIKVTDELDNVSTAIPISPFIHNSNPRAQKFDNDGFKDSNGEYVSNLFETYINTGEERDLSVYTPIDTIDFGFYRKDTNAIIGNRVWLDENRDGIQDVGEEGIAGQVMHLRQYQEDANGDFNLVPAFTRNTTTNASGYYYFDRLPISTVIAGIEYRYAYEVYATSIPQGMTTTKTKVTGSQEHNDNDFITSLELHASMKPIIPSVTVNGALEAVNNLDIDMGLVPYGKGSLSGLVWEDLNKDGLYVDEDLLTTHTAQLEVFYNGSWISVREDDGVMVDPSDTVSGQEYTITGSEYLFDNLILVDEATLTPYEYRVKYENIPLKYKVTDYQVGTNMEINNDFSETTKTSTITATTAGIQIYDPTIQTENDTEPLFYNHKVEHINLGLIPLKDTGIIGDYIWFDENRDGVQDVGEEGIPNVKVYILALDNTTNIWDYLLNADGTRVTQVSDADGKYEFSVPVADSDDLPIKYKLLINRKENYDLSPYKVGVEATDNDFRDYDATDVEHNVLPVDDTSHAVISRDISLVGLGTNGFADYENAVDDKDVDAGFYVFDNEREIGSYVWFDENDDNIMDPTEEGIEGITVKLWKYDRDQNDWVLALDENGDAYTAITDSAGYYNFVVQAAVLDKTSPHYKKGYTYRTEMIYPGNYDTNSHVSVKFDQAFALDGSDGMHHIASNEIKLYTTEDAQGVVDLDTLQSVLDVDLGLLRYATFVTIGDTVFHDINEDGIQDPNEEGIENVKVTLQKYNDTTLEWEDFTDLDGVESMMSDASGNYSFRVAPTDFITTSPEYLSEYQYRVKVEKPLEYKYASVNDNIDSYESYDVAYSIEADVFSGTLASIQDDLDLDFGLVKLDLYVKLSGKAWIDENKNQAIDTDEEMKSMVKVNLYRVDNNGNKDFVSSTTTNVAGEYYFEVLPMDPDTLDPIDYRVEVEVPSGYTLTTVAAYQFSFYELGYVDPYDYTDYLDGFDYGLFKDPDKGKPDEGAPDKGKPEEKEDPKLVKPKEETPGTGVRMSNMFVYLITVAGVILAVLHLRKKKVRE